MSLTPSDASILTRVLQYTHIPRQERRRLLRDASVEARAIGEAILDPNRSNLAPEVREAVEAFRRWAEINRRVGRQQTLRRAVARRK